MDNNSNHDIDKVFRERFEGLKDHSVDPVTQWGAVEGVFETSAGAAASSTAVSSWTGVWSAAASAAAVIGVAGMATMDSNPSDVSERAVGVTTATAKPQSNSDIPSFITWEEAQALVQDQVKGVDDFQPIISTEQEPQDLATATMGTSVLYPPSSGGQEDVLVSNALPAEQAVMHSASTRMAEEIESMQHITLSINTERIIDREALAMTEIAASERKGLDLFVRGGIRLGNGESNSSNNPAQWRMNNVLTVGYTQEFSPITWLTVEVGHLRRSGNGIERSKDIDFSPLMSVISSSYNQVNETQLANELEHVRESLIATTMDFVHMPVQIHVKLQERSNASIGFFTDYLVRAKNESYMVYNSKDYINARFGDQDEFTKEGLKTLRVGLIGGYEHKISDHISADVRGMIPITSIYDRKSEFSIYNEPSQLVDFQFSLIYKI